MSYEKMNARLQLDAQKIDTLIDIKVAYLDGKLSREQAQQRIKQTLDYITPQEFALVEQALQQHGVTDETLKARVDDLFALFDTIRVADKQVVEEGHPVDTYLKEVAAIRELLAAMRKQALQKYIHNPWLELYDKLEAIKVHFARKQNQLYPELEKAGFDKPSKVMWSLENDIRDSIRQGRALLESQSEEAFMRHQQTLIALVEDMMVKEEEILYPTALSLVSEAAFEQMKAGDAEIGFCLIDPPAYAKAAPANSGSGIPTSHESGGKLNVRQGALTLEQINLIYRHLKVDLSYVDENEIVQFYSDTKHRVFPRSPGVIGRDVKNCHPSESVDTVKAIIEAFKAGTQDEAEFWLEIGGRFVYIVYTAVRDDQGTFRGVLEMMQDATHIRSLEGSRRLLSWADSEDQSEAGGATEPPANALGITRDTVIGDLVKAHPQVKAFLLSQSPKFEKLNNPLLFKTMSSIATLDMIARRGDLNVDELIDSLVKFLGDGSFVQQNTKN
ncbi:PAS domain-containing protein [Fusibacter sp. JL298sf-3]